MAKSKVRNKEISIVYKASKTMSKFHRDDSFVKTVIGPIGSGKSVGCIVDTLLRAHQQEPNREGIRQTRWVVIRNTYRELLDTTLITFHEWIKEDWGTFSWKNMKFTLETDLPDGTKLHAEWLFRALDRPKDVKKLLSLEVTGGFINEAREVPKTVFDMLQGRCGRYPKTIIDPETDKIVSGPTWFGVILDTNPPDSDSWYYKLFEENLPDNHRIYKQPSGLSPEAENIKYLPKGYYDNMCQGKDKEWVNVYVHGEYGFVVDGKPIYPEYKDDIHHSSVEYIPDKKLTLYIGIDFGLTPAAVFGQKTPAGRMVLFDELVTFDMGAVNFGKILHERLRTTYRDFKSIEIYADPAGEQRAQTDENTPFMILSAQGINAFPAHTNDFSVRREVVAKYMGKLDFAGNPAFCICNEAKTLRKACAGGYKLKRLQVTGEERFMDMPIKNKYSHVAEAAQYLFLGAVGDSEVVGGFGDAPIDYSNIHKAVA